MAGYLGSTPVPQATQHRESFTATSGQTTFATAGYTAGFVDVYLNGSHLSPADFTATNGSDVVLASGASADDVCDIISYSAFEVNAQVFTGVTSFKLASEGSLAMTIDATGAVTKPLQPAFLAQPASNQNNIAINSAVTVVFGTERFDQNADFASNTFTAPVTGKYQFNTSMRLENWDISASYYQLTVQTSNRNYISTWDAALHASADHDYITLNVPCLADMDANDTAIVTIRQQGGAAQADVQSETFFSGFLAC